MAQKILDTFSFPLFAPYQGHITAAMSCRYGGQSVAPYTSLNLALHVGDDKETVLANRRLFLQQFDLHLQDVVCCEQVHKTNVHTVTARDKGRGSTDFKTAIKDVDALVTNEKGIGLFLFFADCMPIFFYDFVHSAIGLAHAGWRGTVADIAGKTLHTMSMNYDTKPEDCLVAFGPSIGAHSFVVSGETTRSFMAVAEICQNIPGCEKIIQKQSGIYHASLYDTNKALLLMHGVPEHNIGAIPPCTFEQNGMFFSYRAENAHTGRQGALIFLH